MTDKTDTPNETGSEALREVRAMADAKKRNNWKAGAVVATGIGSAALAAALLYANRDRKKGD